MTVRAVFDCNVLLQAAGSPGGPAGACLSLVAAGRITLCVSDDTLAEAAEVMTRPRVRRKLPSLTDAVVDDVLNLMTRIAVRFSPVPALIVMSRDPDDAMYLDLAVAAGAGFVVSWDDKLLEMTDPACPLPDAVAFRASYPTIFAVTPPEFLALLAAMP